MCVFKLSDCTLTEVDKQHLIEIVKILIKYGANKEDAKKYFEKRYGGGIHNENGEIYELLFT